MTDADARAELLAICAIPIELRWGPRKGVKQIATVTRRAGIARITMYKFIFPEKYHRYGATTTPIKDRIKCALTEIRNEQQTLAVDGGGEKHSRMRKHDPSDAVGVAPGPSIAKTKPLAASKREGGV